MKRVSLVPNPIQEISSENFHKINALCSQQSVTIVMLTYLLSNFFTTQNLKTFVLKFSQPHTQVLVQKIISHSYQINTTIIIPLTTPTPTLSSPLKLNCTLKIYFITLLGQQPTFQITKQRPQTNNKLEREWLEPENQLEVHPMDVRQEGFEYQYNYQKGAKETMFEKQLTPSDVGKLNRLVIPKQYAEKHFPPTGKFMNTGENGISLSLNTGEKAILLTFEDEIGKIWRFRYSYWNSSQSYVLTKGWSRFVKEKQLDAGDTVVFARQFVCSGCQLFIGWKRRNATTEGEGCAQHTGRSVQNQLQGGKSKILRLFGVDMECQLDHGFEPPARDGSSTSSQGGCGLLHRPTYMDTDFPRDDIQD